MRSLTFLCLILFCPYLQGQMEAFGKYFQGHSHNDYAQEFPLTTALEKGFSSIEIDVFAHKGQIVVAHDPEDLYLKPSIQELYLEPLFSKERKFKHLILLVDIKICTDNLLELLETSLLPFADHLVSLDDATGKSVQIVLSGDVPKQALLQTKDYPYFFIDGRASDLGGSIES